MNTPRGSVIYGSPSGLPGYGAPPSRTSTILGSPTAPATNAHPGLLGQPESRANVHRPNGAVGSRTGIITNRTGTITNRTGTIHNRTGGPILGTPHGRVDDDGVTPAGRVLGTSRPVDSYGRTEAGRALGTPVYRTPHSSPRVDVIATEPVFWYNPLSGQYERRRGRGASVYVNVLIGTAAPRPGYRFSWGGATHHVFYPYYCHNTLDYGYPVYQSPYFYYGYGPSYIPSTRVIVVPQPIYIDRSQRDDSNDYYLNRRVDQEIDTALGDVRRAWMIGDIDLLLRHVRSDQDVAVYLKGKYAYSLPSQDYRDLTLDAMKNSETSSFKWIGLDERSDEEVLAKAEHTFIDKDGERRTVYVSFTFVKIHGAWWIAGVGSSNNKANL
ncbi:MAG: hypothetical protein KY468_04070 [Armatimonadetes bacterium]|nr:hypothetical protein [Armatimonadota bacterium]